MNKNRIGKLVQAYNATKHDTTGFSFHYLMFGWHPRLAVDAYLEIRINKSQKQIKSRENFAEKLQRRLDFAYRVFRGNIMINAVRYKQNYDQKVRFEKLEVRDRVLVRKLVFSGRSKLADKWERDPYIVYRTSCFRHSCL